MCIIFGLKSMIKQLLNLVYSFLHLKCMIKQLLDSVFVVICKIINVSVRVITVRVIILHITKTSSNNCLLINSIVVDKRIKIWWHCTNT